MMMRVRSEVHARSLNGRFGGEISSPVRLSGSYGIITPFLPSFSKPLLSPLQIYLLGRILAAIRHHVNIDLNPRTVRVENVSQLIP